MLRARLDCSGNAHQVCLLYALPTTWDYFLARNDCIMLPSKHVCRMVHHHALETRYVQCILLRALGPCEYCAPTLLATYIYVCHRSLD